MFCLTFYYVDSIKGDLGVLLSKIMDISSIPSCYSRKNVIIICFYIVEFKMMCDDSPSLHSGTAGLQRINLYLAWYV